MTVKITGEYGYNFYFCSGRGGDLVFDDAALAAVAPSQRCQHRRYFLGIGFNLANLVYLILTASGLGLRNSLVSGLVAIWGVRLALHIYLRNRGKSEDYRYAQWRRDHGGKWWWRSYFRVFILQGAIMWLVSCPLLYVQLAPATTNLLDLAAVIVWLVGFYFEAIGDWQLASFRADPNKKGGLLTSGVWRYTRHPNYFGDAAQWWGIYLFAAAAGGWWLAFSPLLMTYLLLRVSGVSMLEKGLIRTKPGYPEYVEQTNAFFPGFRKKPQGNEWANRYRGHPHR